MALPSIIQHDGALTGSSAPGGPAGELMELLRTTFSATYGMSKGARPSIINATDLAPYVIPLETIVRVRLIGIRTRGAPITVKLTSAAGTLQVFPVSDLLLLHNPAAGSEVTVVQIVGTADVVYCIAGDTA
jgi:hypothetical protein